MNNKTTATVWCNGKPVVGTPASRFNATTQNLPFKEWLRLKYPNGYPTSTANKTK